ncbi:NAD(P)/FAD-dependent oxidoreductase [Marinomonas transparens]|uniref:FAD-binding oxidoreductase n=1 Tax=Marinomonas transparens TaxID=2795388 RepID=A0A934MV28_9GAMM|nr:FAD-dependent oxidoreductase [Marinomonas transparens]MBJ7536574.1 FAD-binding oxidoreductase [Marinomonas transparens]
MSNVYVIGAGIVGVSCALNLLEKGFNVTLIEKEDGVKETSFGNAGVITRSSAYLINNKNLIPSLKKYVFNKHSAVRIKYSYLLKNLPWSSQFLYQSLEKKSEKNIESLNSIIEVSLDEHKKWLKKSGNMHRLRENGWLKLFHSKSGTQSTNYEQSIYKQYGINFELLDTEKIRTLEPALKPIYGSGIHIKDAVSVDHPGEVTQNYIDLFVELGGKVIRDDITRLSQEDSKVILHGRSFYNADEVVIAAGPWSNDLLKTISRPLPMCFERGYHQHFEYPNEMQLTRPIYDVDSAFVLSPMTNGYRLTSGTELNDKDAKINTIQLQKAIQSVQNSITLGSPIKNSLWKGNRPTLPDSLPAIGPHPECKHVWLAFGHQHVGFSTGPATGRLIAELIVGQEPFINITPFLPKRFF